MKTSKESMNQSMSNDFNRGGRTNYSWGDPFFIYAENLDKGNNMTIIKPLNDRLVCKKIDSPDKTTGGIVLPDAHKEKPTLGKVIAVGPGWIDDNGNRHTMNVSVGDTILYTKHAGTTFKIDGQELLVLIEKEVLAVLT